LAQLQSLADAPNTLREYETIYILHPDTINDQVAEVNGRVKSLIEERGGQVLNIDNWGKRKLAYEIKKERKGIYLFWSYLGNAEIVSEFERNMRMIDPVMRYMTIKIDTNIATGSRESEISDESYERAATTAADEEEIATGRAVAASAEASESEASESEASESEASESEASESDTSSEETTSTEEN